jgi:tRNA pseudouridine13 synthase
MSVLMPLQLLPGAKNFQVIEEPAYLPNGSGEHLYVDIEKESLTTDQVAEALAKACGKKERDVGYGGRKDRHAVTRQWFSVHFGDEAKLATLAERLPNGRVHVHGVSRHANKLRMGHLAGNRFVLGLGGDTSGLAEKLARLAHEGIRNRYGPQRFGINGSTLEIAKAWGAGNAEAVVARIIDPSGAWKWGDALPSGYRHGPEGHALGALRRGDDAAKALKVAGDPLRKLAASAAQSAVFNAILDAREAGGLLHKFRLGDMGCTNRGAPFLVEADALDETNRRAAAGVLDAFTTAPMPGTSRMKPSPEVDAQERQWSAHTGVDWSWFADGGTLESPGERRPLLVPFRAAPDLRVDGDTTWVSFALPSGSYATAVLEQVGVTIPDDRRGAEKKESA